MNYLLKMIFYTALLIPSISYGGALDPVLRFTDLVSGPNVGIGDGLGNGAIVTVWGQNLSSDQGDSKIIITDAGFKESESAFVYYWKNADGLSPSGPADLFNSHLMQEVAFSIPEKAVLGNATIHFEVNGILSNKLPFSIRSGEIYHIKPSSQGGSNTNSGSFDEPFLSVSSYSSGAIKKLSDNNLEKGSIFYIHGDKSEGRLDAYGISSSLAKQTSFSAYPGSQPVVITNNVGIDFYFSSGIVFSKYRVLAGNYDEPPASNTSFLSPQTSYGVRTNENGRIIGLNITEQPGRCTSSYHGAIVSNDKPPGELGVGNAKVFGNEIYGWGCKNSSKFTHTTYFSIRNGGVNDVEPWEVAFNYLHDNESKYGIHNYDEESGGKKCGKPTGPILIHDNVVKNQKGSGLTYAGSSSVECWTEGLTAWNNLFINTGLGPADESLIDRGAIFVRGVGGNKGNLNIFHNTFIEWSNDDKDYGSKNNAVGALQFATWREGTEINFFLNNNVFATSENRNFEAFVDSSSGNPNLYTLYGSGNVLFGMDTRDYGWLVNTVITSPELVRSQEAIVSLDSTSSAIDNLANQYSIDVDLYGRKRSNTRGAIEYVSKPKPPSALEIQ